jgi:hypothetical protein
MNCAKGAWASGRLWTSGRLGQRTDLKRRRAAPASGSKAGSPRAASLALL